MSKEEKNNIVSSEVRVVYDFLERLESTCNDKNTCAKIRKFLIEKKIWNIKQQKKK